MAHSHRPRIVFSEEIGYNGKKRLEGAAVKGVKDLKPLIEYLQDIQHLSSAISLLHWDQETYMPPGAGGARAEQLSALGGLAHDKSVGPEMQRILSQWVDLESGAIKGNEETWDEAARALLRESWRDYHKATKLPSEFVRRFGKAASISEQVWVEARKKSDFSRFAPHLKTMIALKKEEADYLGYQRSPYDALLDAYEPGMTVAQLVPLFASLRAKLVPLLEQIVHSPIQPNGDFLHRSYPPEKQLAFGQKVLEAMGYDFNCGRQDISAHPFTTSFHPTDVRITTRVDEGDLLSSLFSSIHEGGHALYDQGLNPDLYGTPLGEARSLGIHESQSRLWENGIGRSKALWRHFYPILQKTFPEGLEGVDLERFYAAINRVQPSLIRVEADELTYNLHIIIRFEIERALIEENLPVEALPALWNEKMRLYLGLTPPSDAQGVLQDIHWSGGAFGYFPTYTLGNLYAIQFLNQAKKEIPDLEGESARGNLLPLKQWLNEKIHRWGKQYASDELILRITGETLNPDYFVQYLKEKFTPIYRLA
ncbi:MAG: carboxypeptidase M32 [Nitrospirae bacterium]|nr:carboxypeptidase M32 [Candidatus Manganitrophaceae bacterium]